MKRRLSQDGGTNPEKENFGHGIGKKLLRGLGYAGIGLTFGLPTAAATFNAQESTVEIAANEVTMSPTYDSKIQLNNSIADIEADSRLPWIVGIDATWGENLIPPTDSIGGNIDAGYEVGLSVAAQPEGELAKIEEVIYDQLVKAGFAGASAGAIAVALVCGSRKVVGEERLAELKTSAMINTAAYAAGGAMIICAATGTLATDNNDKQPSNELGWIKAQNVFPQLDIPGDVKIRNNIYTKTLEKLVAGASDSYDISTNASETFTQDVDKTFENLRQPDKDETVVAVISDRHSNISMDPVANNVAQRAKAKYLIDDGDDTSSGSKWEEFSLRSLDESFSEDDYEQRARNDGNHDYGGYVESYLKERGWMTPNGRTQIFGPARIFLINDPRQSSFTPERAQPGISYDAAKEQYNEAICDSNERGERVNIAAAPKASMGRTALENGCVDLVIGGDTHLYSAPEAVESPDGSVGYEMTVGTTGGAAFAFAGGSKPRREANMVLVTLAADGTPIGTQSVDFTTDKRTIVNDYIPLHVVRAKTTETDLPQSDEDLSIPRKKLLVN